MSPILIKIIQFVCGLEMDFIDKWMIDDDTINNLKRGSYLVIVGQGEKARIKISW